MLRASSSYRLILAEKKTLNTTLTRVIIIVIVGLDIYVSKMLQIGYTNQHFSISIILYFLAAKFRAASVTEYS